jgi:type II secretion system protein L
LESYLKIVGLNIDKGRIAASIIEKGLRQTELKETFSRTFATDVELVDILKAKAGDWAGSRIVASIPGYRFSQRMVQFPFADRKRIEKALPFEIEDIVPFPIEDVELDHLVLDRAGKNGDKKKEAPVLGIMIPKAILRQHLDLLVSAGIDPQMIVPTYVGLYFISKMIPVEGTAVLIDGNDLCLKSGLIVKACRSFLGSQATGGIRHTLKALETEFNEPIEKACLLSANESVGADLIDLGIAVERISPDFHGKKADDPVSLGLALCDQTNFRKNEFAYRLADIGARKRRRTLIIAGIIAAALAAANIGVKSYLVQASYSKLDREIKDIYHQAVPDAKAVGDPVRQLRVRLDETKKKYGALGTGTSALDVMKAVTDGIPKEIRVSFQEFTLEGDRLKLQGEASSFESVDKMKAELQKSPLFSDVAVQDTRMGVDNKVKFRFEMKLKQAL